MAAARSANWTMPLSRAASASSVRARCAPSVGCTCDGARASSCCRTDVRRPTTVSRVPRCPASTVAPRAVTEWGECGSPSLVGVGVVDCGCLCNDDRPEVGGSRGTAADMHRPRCLRVARGLQVGRLTWVRRIRRLAPRVTEPWFAFFLAARLVATAFAAALVVWGGISRTEALMLLYGPLSTAVIALSRRVKGVPAVWAFDFAARWRSSSLRRLAEPVLPHVARLAGSAGASLPLRRAVLLAIGASARSWSSPSPAARPGAPAADVDGDARDPPVAAAAARVLAGVRRRARCAACRASARTRAAGDRGGAPADRLGAARLGQAATPCGTPARQLDPGPCARSSRRLVGRATIELESASSDMDTSLAELRSPLEGRRLDEALRTRAASCRHGRAVHQRAGLRAGAVAARRRARVPDRVRGDHQRASPRRRDHDRRQHRAPGRRPSPPGPRQRRGLADVRPPGASGLLAMENRAATHRRATSTLRTLRSVGHAVELASLHRQQGGAT